MKKKILALLSAAAMTVTALAVPFTASAEEIENVVFQSGEETQWLLRENNTGGGTKTASDYAMEDFGGSSVNGFIELEKDNG